MFRHFLLDMELYIFEDYHDFFPELTGKNLTDALLVKALDDFGCNSAEILRTKRGKPYIEKYEDVHISASHSGKNFACLIGDAPLGVDIQEECEVDINAISGRYFAADERRIVSEGREKAFFLIWTRREAYAKYTGRGIGDVMRGSSVLNKTDVIFFEPHIEKGIYCSCCIRNVNQKRKKYRKPSVKIKKICARDMPRR